MSDFERGAALVFRGVGEFYRRPKLWRFVALPLVLVLAIYGALFYAILAVWMPRMCSATREFFAGGWFEFLGPWAEFLIEAGCWLGLGVLTALFAGNVFEVLGGYCFSRLVREYETQVLQLQVVEIPASRRLRNLAERGMFSTVTMIFYLMFFIAGFFIPVIMPLAMIVLVGYRYAVIYASDAVFDSGHRLSDVATLFAGRSGLLYGFGSIAFLIFLVPILPIFLIPGLVIGGTLMYHTRKD